MHRVERLSSLLREEISWILERDIKDPAIGMVTITGVELTKDYRLARVSFSSLASEGKTQEEQQSLNRACPFIRKLLGKRLDLKIVPEIVFKRDLGTAHAQRIEEIISRLHGHR
jgi:ribosome-binding factor A